MEVNNKVVEYLIGKLYEDLERKTHELSVARRKEVEMNEAFEEATREIAKRDLKIQELEAEMLKSTIESVGSEVRRGRPKKEV